MRRLIPPKGIRYYFFLVAACRHLTENSKRGLLMLVMKIKHPKILKWKKKNDQLTKTKQNKKTPASRDENMTSACAFSMNQSVVTCNTQ